MSTAPQTAVPPFDAEKYKRTTLGQWDAAAEAWHRWGPLLHEWLGPATEAMLDLARVSAGSRVLDVAAGAGEQSMVAARRVGPTGHVLASDLSPRILEYAAAQAKALGLASISTRVLDGENLDVPPGTFDAVISRVGLIYFPDQQRALAGMKRALKPGGRVAAIVYSTGDKNGFFSIPVGIIRRRAALPPPAPGQPGPFSLGGPGVLAAALEKAGFREVSTVAIPSPVRLPSAKECVRFERESFGALHQMLSGLDDAGKAAAWAEIEESLRQFEQAEGFIGPCEMLVGVGVN